jgi:ribosome biogenesis GTPase
MNKHLEFDFEESFHEKLGRKDEKKQKKIASNLDRSKYKKSDAEKHIQRLIHLDNEKKGRVLSIVSQDIVVDSDGEEFVLTLRGTLKQEKQRIKNLITVGDIVYFQEEHKGSGSIHRVEERTSFLSRNDHLHKRSQQLLAANIDLVLITNSVAYPDLKPSLIDRYIIASEKGGMTPIVLMNKIDLLRDEKYHKDQKLYEETYQAYRDLGYKVIALSCHTDEGFDELKEVMKNKTSVFSGQSGTGKSSLINKVTGLDLNVGELTKKTLKGGHTTTQAKLVKLPFGGFCIDTPGIRSFGVWGLEKDEVRFYFHEFEPLSPLCKYPNCTHTKEPQCKVIEAIEQGRISHLRYDSYLKLLQNEDWEII